MSEGGTLRLVVVVKDGLRHRLFLRLVSHALGEYHDVYTFMSSASAIERLGWSADLIWKRCSAYKHRLRSIFISKPAVDPIIRRLLNLEPLLDRDIKHLWKTVDVNSDVTLGRLRSINPDLIIIYGSPILKGDWIGAAKLGAMNMHYGILPWYRSGNSTQFSILHERLDRIGATIHYIDSGVDTGPIIAKSYVNPNEANSLDELIAAVYIKGAQSLIDCAMTSLENNERLPCVREYADQSFYPARYGTKYVEYCARYRFDEAKKVWPSTEIEVEKHALPLPRTFKYHLPVSAPNGVYIFMYHGLVDKNKLHAWERSYDRVLTNIEFFQDHVNHLITEGFVPIRLSDVPEVLKFGECKKRYFVVTFDDAYCNIAIAKEFLCSLGVLPAVFVCGAFCDGIPYYRALAAMLRDCKNGSVALKKELLKLCPNEEWSDNPRKLFNQTKDLYFPGKTEAAVTNAFQEVIGAPEKVNIHLNKDSLSMLEKVGWQIGNHTWRHQTLSSLNEEDLFMSIEKNQHFIRDNFSKPLDWLAYPNGLGRHVNDLTKKWLDLHPEMNGIFAGGGVNIIYSRTQWLRIGVPNLTLSQFKRQLRHNISVMNSVMRRYAVRPSSETFWY